MRRQKVVLFLSGLVILTAVLILPQGLFAQELSYDGGSELGVWVMPEAAKIFEAKTGKKFKSISYVLGSGKGLEAAMEGNIPMAGVSRVLTAEEKKKVYSQIVGYDAIAIYVNAKNPVTNLSKEQLKAIYKGKITNWKEVGGKDAKIIPVTEALLDKGATLRAFQDTVLDSTEFGPTIKEVDRSHNAAKYVGAYEDAIGYASIAFKNPKIRPISFNNIKLSDENVRNWKYTLSRPLNLVTKEQPTGDLKKFFEFILSPEGQAIVSKHFIPVKP
ncbi:MAG: hypothetical protein A2073_07690 [Deltaproteobacteria bacterium GWC2_42_11]|nr:MAG: hypothetical protein A2073_07690 [Deltaproteobacteria bacterium GWC2_42_11]HBO84418.1 phosphate-binding protein [Deltaproteobacteria bacterium]